MCIRDRYIEAGSDIILTNTFGANALKFHDDSCSLEEIIKAAVSHVKKAEREALLQTGDERKIYTAPVSYTHLCGNRSDE